MSVVRQPHHYGMHPDIDGQYWPFYHAIFFRKIPAVVLIHEDDVAHSGASIGCKNLNADSHFEMKVAGSVTRIWREEYVSVAMRIFDGRALGTFTSWNVHSPCLFSILWTCGSMIDTKCTTLPKPIPRSWVFEQCCIIVECFSFLCSGRKGWVLYSIAHYL